MENFISWHVTVHGIRKALRLTKLFQDAGFKARWEEIIERVMNETPKYYGNCMVLVSNPGIDNQEFEKQCNDIYKQSNL